MPTYVKMSLIMGNDLWCQIYASALLCLLPTKRMTKQKTASVALHIALETLCQNQEELEARCTEFLQIPWDLLCTTVENIVLLGIESNKGDLQCSYLTKSIFKYYYIRMANNVQRFLTFHP